VPSPLVYNGGTPVVASFIGDDLLGTPIAGGHYSQKGLVVKGQPAGSVVVLMLWLSKSDEMETRIAAYDNTVVMPDGVEF